jgi:hypothetical protein
MNVLSGLRDVIAAGKAHGMGLSSAAELDRSTLAGEIPVYLVGSDAILDRMAGADLLSVLGAPVEMLYPIVVDGEERSAVVMTRNVTGEWEVSGVGRSKLSKAFAHASATLAAHGATSPFALVAIPEAGVRFVAYQENGTVRLASFDEGGAGLPLEEDLAAETALPKVAQYLRAHRAPSN